ncbi:ATP-binding cassette domain-containing protein [Corynebacterium poyangense]|uniref:ABC-type quaternary amine transporter n=1 Tax=Corynebacterium poyangense TaxID=2684405 RepID=A0A7H0SMX3_9CORY|nr:ABC transporter ATP-binding protein [Corynebacterium poyangense]QNQ89898.1 ATP-binding cassette domain-containing protein [Corynebacterium poyangense]
MIEFRDVSKHFGDTKVVDNFSIEIPSHSSLALVGSSGCGKTTLLRMVNRMVEPDSGSVCIDGEDVAGVNPVLLRRSIGYVIQGGGLLPHRTVLDNVATVGYLLKWDRGKARRRARSLLQKVGLDSQLEGRYPAELSGGQQQRVGVARALLTDPNILLMDEPFGAVDPIVRYELQRKLLALQQDLGKTIILVTHDIAEAFYLADKVAVLEPGARIAQWGTPQDIKQNPQSDFVRAMIRAVQFEDTHDVAD